jgi:uncharacterized protein YdcH (DUF465 family)
MVSESIFGTDNMANQTTRLSLTDRFPHLQQEIRHLAEQDSGFRQLFDDYELLTRSIGDANPEADRDLEEMISLKTSLEVEALEILSQVSAGR